MSASTKVIQAAAGVETGGGAGNAWDVSTAQWLAEDVNIFTVVKDNTPESLFFKPDGLKMYIAGSSGDDVYEYDLSTAWDISTASYLQEFSISGQEAFSQGLFFKPDGTKMYVTGRNGDDVNEYNLSTAWDVSSASFQQSFDVSSEETDPSGLFFKPDGTKMYVSGFGSDGVNEYDLSTAWDVSSASFLQFVSVNAEDPGVRSVFFKPDGTKMYIVGSSDDKVNEYDLSTAWDISSASHAQNFDVSSQENTPLGLSFKSDGTVMYVVGSNNDTVFQYQLSTAWDISSASFTEISSRYLDVSAQETGPKGLFFKPDGLKLYITGQDDDEVNEYDLSTAWDISSASFLQNFSVSAQETRPRGLFFKPDGTKMYVTGLINDKVNEYDLSTAWDISSASFNQDYTISDSIDDVPEDVFFKPDGLKMYIIGGSTDRVVEYNLSTAWDVSSASYAQIESISAQETSPTGLFFKPDGLKMYIVGSQVDEVNEYDLSTAWDISSLSYLQNFKLSEQENIPNGLFFKPDGLKMYVIGSDTDSIYEYDL